MSIRAPLLALTLALVGCNNHIGIGIDETDVGDDGDTDDTDVEPDYSAYDDATLRIVTPTSGSFLALEDMHDFEAEVIGTDGLALPVDGLSWASSVDGGWAHEGLSFEDNTLSVGMHDITAQVELPNGDRLAYTAGGILVQSKWAGTYTGLFSADVTGEYQGQPITVTCSGATTMIVDLEGTGATGDADCLLSLLGFDLPATFGFELENDDGQLAGTASVDLVIFDLPMDCTGSIDLDSETMELAFGGEIPSIGSLDGSVDADRVSRGVE